MKSILKLLFPFLFILVISSCKKDDDSDLGPGLGQTGSSITTSFSGFVRDLQGNPVAGAIVSAGGQTAMTNSTGGYKIENASVDKKRAVIEANKTGYWLQQKGIIAESGTINYADLVLFPEDKSYTISGTGGGTVVMPGGTEIIFPSNAFVTSTGSAYTGTVYITGHEILTAASSFSSRVPGGDFKARNNAGMEGVLLSYGMAGAKLFDASGNIIMLNSGVTATVKFPVNPLQTSAPSVVQLWHYDESLKLWKEEGSATRIGNFYVGAVSHFSWWNCDDFSQMASLSVHVTGCNGVGLYRRIDLTAFSQTVSDYSSSNGYCSGLIPANTPIQVSIYNTQTNTLDTTFTIGPFADGSSNTVNVSLPAGNCNFINVNLTDCSGAPVSGTVVVYLNGLYSGMINVQNGTYVLNNAVYGNYMFYAASGSFAGTDSLNFTSSTPLPASVTIALCDTIQSGANSFTATITSAAFGTVNISLSDVTSRFQLINGIKHVVLTYTDPVSQDSGSIYIKTPGYAPGTYAWNTFDSNVSGVLIQNGQMFQINSNLTPPVTGFTHFTSTPPVGSNIIGEFSGNMLLTLNGISTNAAVNATFNALRIQ